MSRLPAKASGHTEGHTRSPPGAPQGRRVKEEEPPLTSCGPVLQLAHTDMRALTWQAGSPDLTGKLKKHNQFWLGWGIEESSWKPAASHWPDKEVGGLTGRRSSTFPLC